MVSIQQKPPSLARVGIVLQGSRGSGRKSQSNGHQSLHKSSTSLCSPARLPHEMTLQADGFVPQEVYPFVTFISKGRCFKRWSWGLRARPMILNKGADGSMEVPKDVLLGTKGAVVTAMVFEALQGLCQLQNSCLVTLRKQ